MKKPFSVIHNEDPKSLEDARLKHEADSVMYLALAAACSMLDKHDKSRHYKELSDAHRKRSLPLSRDSLKVIPGKDEE